MLTILPTHNCGLSSRMLIIGVIDDEGHMPVSWSRGPNVGVGGRHLFCKIAPGEPVRRATLNEMRRLARMRIAELQRDWPQLKLFVQRVR